MIVLGMQTGHGRSTPLVWKNTLRAEGSAQRFSDSKLYHLLSEELGFDYRRACFPAHFVIPADEWTQNEPTHNWFSDWELGVALAATWPAPLPSPATKMWVMDRFWEKGPGERGASRYAPDSKGERSTARSCPANHFQNATGPCPRHPPGARRPATKR
jgi:hypothetical protein